MNEEMTKDQNYLIESLDLIDRAIQGTNDFRQTMQDVLDAVLSIFDCDRAFLMFPCDPEASTWQVPMERNRPEYPGALEQGIEIPMEEAVAETLGILLASDKPVKFGPGTPYPLPEEVSKYFGFKCFMSMVLYPKTGKPWQFGIHQCTHARDWTAAEERLFQAIGRRLGDGLTSLLTHKNLEESNEKYRLIFENSPVPIWEEDFSLIKTWFDDLKNQGITDIETYFDRHPNTVAHCLELAKIVDVNLAAVALHGATTKDGLIEGLPNIFLPESSVAFRRLLICLWNGETGNTQDSVVKTITGDPRDVTIFYSVCPGYETTLSKIFVSFIDITEKKQLQAKLQQAQKMESIGTLAGGIAHDFNNILSSILGFTELALGNAQKDTELEDDLQEVRMAGLRAKELVKQILAFARQSDEAVQPIQVNIIVKEVLKFIKSSIPTTIQINSKITSDSFIMGSSTQIHQVLMNLCTNAAQSMEKNGGILEVSVNDIAIDSMAISNLKSGAYIEIKVSDTGQGISPQHMHTIFEPYFTTKPVGEGTGLGLAVAHGIIESYGGQITVDSTLTKGTCFTIYLPISEARIIHTDFEREDLPLGTERILFVDDDASIAKMGCLILEQLGYTVTTRTNSIDALELFKSNSQMFDLVVTDMTMPNMTGDKLAIELMKIRSDIPVVLCTGYSKKISEETAAEININALAYKPIVKADLAKTVRNVLNGIIIRGDS